MKKQILDSVVIGQDCHGNYLELSAGRLYVDKIFDDILPGDRITIRVISETQD